MTPQLKLTIANVVMALGIAPLTLACIFVALNLATGWDTKPDREAVALAMVISTLYTWGWGLVCALPACIASLITARRNPGLPGGRVMRRAVCVLLLLPPVVLTLYPHH